MIKEKIKILFKSLNAQLKFEKRIHKITAIRLFLLYLCKLKIKKMETIILRGDSKVNSKLLLKLAKQLNFSAKKLSADETEEIGITISIKKGLKSGLLNEEEKQNFLNSLKQA